MIFKKIRYFRFLASLKFAVVNLILITLASIVGTVVESKLDARSASYWVYSAYWFYLLLIAFGINIFSVAMTRWPWKRKHTPFLLAHLGILLMLYGAAFSKFFGVDGQMFIPEGVTENTVEFQDEQLVIQSANRTIVTKVPWAPPGRSFSPIRIPELNLVIDAFLPHAQQLNKFLPAEKPKADLSMQHPAIKLQISGGPMGAGGDFWLWTGDYNWSTSAIGLADFSLRSMRTDIPDSISGEQKSFVKFRVISGGNLAYEIYSRKQNKKSSGVLQVGSILGSVIDLGWMPGMQLKVLDWISDAERMKSYEPSAVQYGNAAPSSAIRLNSQLWLGLDEQATLDHRGEQFKLIYTNRRLALPFSLRLEKFHIDVDQGTRNPAAYSSLVSLLNGDQTLLVTKIQMNEPLKWGGYTFYQASYIDDPSQKTTTILSVNRDPGRIWKYLGAMLIVLGSVLLFAVKQMRGRENKVSVA